VVIGLSRADSGAPDENGVRRPDARYEEAVAVMAIIVIGLAGTLAGAGAAVLVLVACGIRREDRACSMAGEPPGALARVARRILGVRSDPLAAVILRNARGQPGSSCLHEAAWVAGQADRVAGGIAAGSLRRRPPARAECRPFRSPEDTGPEAS
jgi:hypothetical protein